MIGVVSRESKDLRCLEDAGGEIVRKAALSLRLARAVDGQVTTEVCTRLFRGLAVAVACLIDARLSVRRCGRSGGKAGGEVE